MALHLVTGYAGTEHVTSADQGAYYMGTFGEGQFVLNRGAKFAATVVSNNSVSIADGEALMQGRFIKMTMGTSESVSIDNGTSGMKRNDLIVIRYSKNAGTGIETAALAVIKGTPDATTPADPEYTEGDITDGTDLVNDMPLYRVSLDGINIDSLTQLFAVKTSMVEYMNEYQLPIATDTRLGGVKVGPYLSRDDDGTIDLPEASSVRRGGLKINANYFGIWDGLLRHYVGHTTNGYSQHDSLKKSLSLAPGWNNVWNFMPEYMDSMYGQGKVPYLIILYDSSSTITPVAFGFPYTVSASQSSLIVYNLQNQSVSATKYSYEGILTHYND